MIDKVRIKNYLGNELVMELRRPEKSGFLIFNMTGLGPEKAEIRTSDMVTGDGGFYNSARIPIRNITLSLRFWREEGKTIEEIRHESYKYFPLKKPITLTIETDQRISVITGYLEANEPVIFSKETHTTLSIICPDPYFYEGGPDAITVTMFSGVEPEFEFPFSNESLTEPMLIMGNIFVQTQNVIYYKGDAEIGITIIIDAIGDVHNLDIYNVGTREKMSINTDRLTQMTGRGIVAGDKIIISTVRGNKSIKLFRDGLYINILNVLNKGPAWFQLTKGDNIFAFEAEFGTSNVSFRIENKTIYEGI